MAQNLDTVMARIKELEIHMLMFANKELKVLAEILREDEMLEYVAQGLYKNGLGLLCATSKRLLFIDKGFFSLKMEEFPLKSVSSVSFESGMMYGKIKIYASGNNAEISNIDKGSAKVFADIARNLIDGRDVSKNKTQSEKNSDKDVDVYEQLEKLAALKDKKIITEAEFQAKKSQLLGL